MALSEDIAELEHAADAALGQGKYQDALKLYRTALSKAPETGRLHAKVATVHVSLNDLNSAVAGFQDARRYLPQSLAVLNNLGSVLADVGRKDEAIAVLKEAISLNPNYPQAQYNLGRTYESLGRWADANAAYASVLQLDEHHEQALLGLIQIAGQTGADGEAASYIDRALQLHPASVPLHVNAAQFAMRCGELDAAIRHAEHAATLGPYDVPALTTLGSLAAKRGDWRKSQAAFERALAVEPLNMYAWSAMLSAASYQSALTPAEVYARHRQFGEALEAAVPVTTVQPSPRQRTGRIRLGFVSSDFREHACACFLLPLFAAHDKSRFDIVLYSNNPKDDAVTARFKAVATAWRDIRYQSDDDAAKAIRDDGIDILIDCNGHTEGHRLGIFARKPSLVSVTYLGLPITTGLGRIDYRLTDAMGSLPDEGNSFDSERLVRLPNGYATYQPLYDLPAVNLPPSLTAGVITFGSFSNRSKLTSETLSLWARILNAVPNSNLLLKDRVFGTPEGGADIVSFFASAGIASHRITLRGMTSISQNYIDYQSVDIALDPMPFNGYTTTCDALVMGVPVIAVFGDRYMARVSASVLGQMGCHDLIAKTTDDAVRIAVELVSNPARLAHLRSTLRATFFASPIGNPQPVVRDIEAFYEAAANRNALPFV